MIADAQEKAADHQLWLALATVSRHEHRRRAADQRARDAARNPKWARTHQLVDRAAQALSNL